MEDLLQLAAEDGKRGGSSYEVGSVINSLRDCAGELLESPDLQRSILREIEANPKLRGMMEDLVHTDQADADTVQQRLTPAAVIEELEWEGAPSAGVGNPLKLLLEKLHGVLEAVGHGAARGAKAVLHWLAEPITAEPEEGEEIRGGRARLRFTPRTLLRLVGRLAMAVMVVTVMRHLGAPLITSAIAGATAGVAIGVGVDIERPDKGSGKDGRVEEEMAVKKGNTLVCDESSSSSSSSDGGVVAEPDDAAIGLN